MFIAYFVQSSHPKKGTWIWDAPTIRTHKEDIITFCKQNGVTDIYLYIDRQKVTPKDYAFFIKEAAKNNIRVEALAGDPSWGLKEKRVFIQDFIEWVYSYNFNVSEKERFSGIHLDIEPYLLPDWKKNKNNVIAGWLSNLEFLAKEAHASGLQVTVDLPFWVDKIEVPDYHDYALSTWMLKRFDTLVLMDYRDSAEDPDGIIDNALDTVIEASAMEKSVLIAVEMARSGEGDKTTFYEEGHQVMEEQLEITEKQLTKHSGFQGFAIHGFPDWMSSYQKHKKGE